MTPVGAVERVAATLAFGDVAHQAYDRWAVSNPGVSAVQCLKVAHPAAVDRDGTGNDAALKGWDKAVKQLGARSKSGKKVAVDGFGIPV